MYHRLASSENYKDIRGIERIFTLSADRFDNQIAYLKSDGYRFVTPDEVRLFAAGELELPEKSVLITFDDGCLSVREYAFPILQQHGARATLFVTTDMESQIFKLTDGTQRRLTDVELRAIDGDIINVQSHTVTHRPLSGLSDEQVEFELIGSRKYLMRLLSRRVNYLAIPGNWFDSRTMQMARKAGYKAVWCSNPGEVKPGSNLFSLPRLSIEGGMNLAQFRGSISPWGIRQRKIVSLVKRTPAHILGPRYWLPLRKILLRCIPGGRFSYKIVTVMLLVLILLAISFIAIAFYFKYL